MFGVIATLNETKLRREGQMSTPTDPVPPLEGALDTDFTIGQDNIEGQVGPFGFDIHNPVFVVSSLTAILFIVLSLIHI